MSLTSCLCKSYRDDNRVTYDFLMTISKLNITTEKYVCNFIDKKADQYQIIIFKLEDIEQKILNLGKLN